MEKDDQATKVKSNVRSDGHRDQSKLAKGE